MPKKMMKKSAYLGVFILFLNFIVSCEKDFTDIGKDIVTNTKFETKDTIIEVEVSYESIDKVKADGLGSIGSLGQYLLGVYNNPNNSYKNYKTLKASIVTQLSLPVNLKLVAKNYGADTTVVSKIDTAFIKLPYQVTLESGETNKYILDSIIGDKTKSFSVNVYRLLTYLNRLNPNDPSKINEFASDYNYQRENTSLNGTPNFLFKPNKNDTVFYAKRKMQDGTQYDIDTIEIDNKKPFARIPLNNQKIKEFFLDEYNSSNFKSQENFNDYFRGLVIEATGNEGSVIGFNLSKTELKPSLEVYYTNIVLKTKNGVQRVVDTIKKNNSFYFGGISNSRYEMNQNNTLTNRISLQGTAGSKAQIKIFGDNDLNSNNVPDQLEVLRNKNWLINDANLTFYVDQDVVKFDTISSPNRLFLYKDGIKDGKSNPSQLSDMLVEGPTVLGGFREIKDKRPYKYTFKITDYISKLLKGETNYLPKLGLKVFNHVTDLPSNAVDTIVKNYSWNPKVVTILNHSSIHGEKRARLKISYTIKK